MKPKHGEQTGMFGRWLTQYLEDTPMYRQYLLYYDHGCKQSEPNVVVIKGFWGESVTNKNRLADVDLIVANPNKEAMLLIEIEERESSPKKILGDVFAILMCNHFAVRQNNVQHYFNITPETKLIVAGIVPTKVHKKRINEIIGLRLQKFTSPDNSIDVKNVAFVFRENISSTIEELKEKMKELFPQ